MKADLSDSEDDTVPRREPAAAGEPAPPPVRRKRDRLGWALCLLGLLGSLGLLTSPLLARAWLAFDMLSHFELHYAIAAGAFAIGLAVPLWRLRIAIALCAIGFAVIGGWAHWQSSMGTKAAQARPAGDRAIRVMTFNTWLSNRDWQAVAGEVVRHDPDIVTLMEFGPEKAPLLDSLRSAYPHQVNCLESHHCHMALLSKFPIESWRARTGWEGPPVLWAQIAAGGGVNVFAIHTLRPPHFRAQMKQIVALARLVRRTEGLKIVMGDFNATPFSRTLGTFAERSGLDRMTRLPTWPSHLFGLPQLAIDHIFVSPEIAAETPAVIGDATGSDHYPVVMTLRPAAR